LKTKHLSPFYYFFYYFWALTGVRWLPLATAGMQPPQPNIASIEIHSKERGLAQQNCCSLSINKGQ